MMTTNFRKLPTGNYVGRNGKYYAFIFKRPHGKWCAMVSLNGQSVASEGYFSTSLHTIGKAMSWVDGRIEMYKQASKQLK